MIQNPILPGFCPDPSIIRVGEDYYIAKSNGAKIIKEELMEWDSEAQKEIVNILADIIESDELIGFDRNDILSLAD